MSVPQDISLTGRGAIVTGASRGLGLEIAQRFAKAGAHLVLGARNEAMLTAETASLAKAYPDLRITSHQLDVANAKDVERFVAHAAAELGSIDILVNNAGVYGPMGSIESVDWDGWVEAFAINVYGSVLMARSVVPYMKRQRSGAIIQLSGGGATSPLPGLSAYAASKAAIVRFAETLALEVKEYGITVNAIAPGALNTHMLDELLAAGPDKVGQDFYDRALKQQKSGGTPLSKGADAALFLASDAATSITGRLISAVWDRYEDWPAHAKELCDSDLYTLRRISGRDRGHDWGDR